MPWPSMACLPGEGQSSFSPGYSHSRPVFITHPAGPTGPGVGGETPRIRLSLRFQSISLAKPTFHSEAVRYRSPLVSRSITSHQRHKLMHTHDGAHSDAGSLRAVSSLQPLLLLFGHRQLLLYRFAQHETAFLSRPCNQAQQARPLWTMWPAYLPMHLYTSSRLT